MRPTRPSIMSEGATMSAPAAACDSAARASCSTVGSLSDLLADQDAAVAVRRVLAQADVGDDQQAGHLALERADGRLHGRFGIVGARADRVLFVRQAEEQHALDAVRLRGRRFLHRLVHGQLEHARHRAHFAALAFTRAHEQRIDEHVGREPRLAHQRAHRRRSGAADAAGGGGRAGPRRRPPVSCWVGVLVFMIQSVPVRGVVRNARRARRRDRESYSARA